MEKKVHYLCIGDCGTFSDKPGFCRIEDCVMYLQPFEACNCTDGRHYDRVSVDSDASPKEKGEH